jgi:hypothetical protein
MNVQNHYPFHVQPVPQGQTRFQNQGMPAHMELRRSESEIKVDSYYPQEDFSVRKSGEEVKMDHFGFNFDVTFRRQGDDIEVDRAGIHNDLKVERDSSTIKLDRPGVQNDVTVSFRDNEVQVHSFDPNQRVTLQRRGDQVRVTRNGFSHEQYPAGLHPGGWPEEPSLLSVAEFVGMEPQTADALDRWAAEGVDMDDLVRVDRQGQIYDFSAFYQ